MEREREGKGELLCTLVSNFYFKRLKEVNGGK